MTTAAPPDKRTAKPRAAALRVPGDRIDGVIALIYLQWTFLIYEPTWFMSQFGGGALFKRIPTLLDIPLFLLWIGMAGGRGIYFPLLAFLGLLVMWLPFLDNRGLGMAAWRVMYSAILLVTASAAFIKTPKRAQPIILLYVLGFLWYGLHGLPGGLVGWHSALGNEDAFGPLMVMGAGFSFYMASAARSKNWSIVFYGVFGLSVVGVIASFARGAVLSLGIVFLVLWWRSSRKFVLLVAAIPATFLLLFAISSLHPDGAFFEEMSTVTEGTDTGTTGDRWMLWTSAIEIWETRPMLGTGPQHWGIVAARTFVHDPDRGFYANPLKLYGRSMHNTILEILVEYGIVGFSIFLYILFDFRRRIRKLKKPGRGRIWDASTGGEFNLAQIATGLELAMIGWLADCMFYGLLYFHWLWTMVGLAWILTNVTDGRPPREGRPRRSDDGAPPGASRPGLTGPSSHDKSAASLGGGLIARPREPGG